MKDNGTEWVAWLGRLMERELAAIEREVNAYPDDDSLWEVVPGIKNPGGALALHVAGNLRYFVGALLGGSGYVRNREAEFGTRRMSRKEVALEIADARKQVHEALASFPSSRLGQPFPVSVLGCTMDTGSFLTHLLSHLGYHLGQLDYHRRITTGSPVTVGTVSIPEVFAHSQAADA